jgi:hypothetical protein
VARLQGKPRWEVEESTSRSLILAHALFSEARMDLLA